MTVFVLTPPPYLRPTANEDVMNKEDIVPIAAERPTVCRLSADRKTVRLALPPLPIAGQPEPIALYVDFNADTLDAMLERLSILRGQMLPSLPAPNKRN
jgi:hypothetical protein